MGFIKNNARLITGLLLVATFLVWMFWDIIAFSTEENSTISVVITDFAYYSPPFCVVVGVLIGHWFFPAKGSTD